MLVTFRTKAYADITMFGDVAVRLLRLMGHSGTIPGALLADDIGPALERLKAAVEADREASAASATSESGDSVDEPVSLANRALPLMQLLEAAQRQGVTVMWDK